MDMDMEEADQKDTVEEIADQNNVDFTRFLFYYRKECGYDIPSNLLQEIPVCDEPVKLSLKTFLDLMKKVRTAQGRNSKYIGDGDSLLHVAVVENMPEYADYLISVEKINVNLQNIYGESPLFEAIRMNRTDLINILLGANCDASLTNLIQKTPLHLAIDDTKVSLRLIQAGADINAQDSDKNTPLHWAVIAGAVETVCMLLFFNADANLPRYDGFTPFMCAVYAQHHEIQDILINYVVDFNACAWKLERTTILSLVLNGDGHLLQDVIDKGADVDQRMLLQAMLKAVQCQNMDVFRIIWKYFEPDEMYQCSILEKIEEYSRTPAGLNVVLRIILESGKLQPLFVNFKNIHLCKLALLCDEMTSISLVKNFMLTYVAHGYKLDSHTIRIIYSMTGYSEYLEILLHMDIDLKPKPLPNALSSVLTHIDVSMAELKTSFTRDSFIDLSLLGFINFEPKRVPSLMELSRDASRDHLVKKFKLVRTKDYYFLVKNLPISAIYKDILTFKKCIYDIVERDADSNQLEEYPSYYWSRWCRQVFVRNPRHFR